MLIVLLIRKSHPLLEIRPQKLGQASFLDVSQTSGEISLSTTHEHGRFTIYLTPISICSRATDKQRICVFTQCKTSNTQLKSNLSVSKTHTKTEIRKQIKMRA